MTPTIIAGYQEEIRRYCADRQLDQRRCVTLTPQTSNVTQRLQGFAAGTEIVVLPGSGRVPHLFEMIRVRGMKGVSP